MLVDDETGRPKALINATLLNAYRTAAADAVAVDVLARPDATSLGLIGAGRQASFDARAVCRIRRVTKVRIWNRTAEAARRAAAELADLAPQVEAVDRIDEAGGCDIVITATASRTPLLERASVRPGTHISAMGADQPGKQELALDLVEAAQLFADDPAQSVSIGELQHASVKLGLPKSAITPIGAVLRGEAKGRAAEDSITLFDSSGTALQDLLVAEAVLAAAIRADRAAVIEL
jgi:ornithine cyclodeaminase